MMNVITKRLEFDAAHRVLGHEGKCAHLHGHRYAVEVSCTQTEDPSGLDEIGRVVDFGKIKECFGRWLDENLDHGTVVNCKDIELCAFLRTHNQKRYFLSENPTAENIAKHLHGIASVLLSPSGITVVQVKVYETPTCSATYRED